MLAEINKYRDVALTLLNWLVYARSPLSLGELTEATIIDLENGSVNTDDRGSSEDIFDILAGLVAIDESVEDEYSNKEKAIDDGENDYNGMDTSRWYSTRLDAASTMATKVKLAHYSIREYLESERIAYSRLKHFHLNAAQGHRVLAQSCLTYLLYYSSSPQKKSTTQDLATFPMLKYTARTWLYHSSQQQSDDISREISLLCSERAKHDWLLVHQPDRLWGNPFEASTQYGSALYYASLGGLGSVVDKLLSSGFDVKAQGENYSNALQAASVRGYETVVKMLMDSAADVNAQGGYYGNALQAASSKGHETVVKMLVNGGADVNAQGGYYGNALQAASFGGMIVIVDLLLYTGAKVNA